MEQAFECHLQALQSTTTGIKLPMLTLQITDTACTYRAAELSSVIYLKQHKGKWDRELKKAKRRGKNNQTHYIMHIK
jgi:hypothetical protein